MWSACRWQTYHILRASFIDLKAAGINSPADLISFPWDNPDEETGSGNMPTDEEIAQMQAEMREYNKRIDNQKE